MPFELDVATEAKMTKYIPLSDKDREPDTNPGASMAFTLTTENNVLTMFDGALRSSIFCKNANSSGQQESIVADLPNLTNMGRALGEFPWDVELTGYTLTFDYGLAGQSNFQLKDCKLYGFRLQGKEGGSTVVKFLADAPDANQAIHGKLAFLKDQNVKILLAPPPVEAPSTQTSLEPGMPSKRGKGSDKQTPEQAMAATLGQTQH